MHTIEATLRNTRSDRNLLKLRNTDGYLKRFQ